MVQIGKMNRLPIKEKRNNIIYLDGGKLGDIPLHASQSAMKHQSSDEIEVFIYVDKEQQLVATIQKPYATVGEFAQLRVIGTSPAGAFMGWGLKDDLFVPKSEQLSNMRKDSSHVVYVFLSEKTKRITASSKLNKFLDKQAPEYKEGEEVELLIYAKTDLGYSAVVNNSHTGMIYENEIFQKLALGQRLQGYVKKIRDDEKIDLRLQQTGYQRVDDVSQSILDTIKNSGNMVSVTDKSPPEEIYALFGVSKKVFKKAIGALYKKRLIVIDSSGIKLAE